MATPSATAAARPASILSVNVGRVVEMPDAVGKSRRTAIDKRARPGRVPVGRLGLTGDEQADTVHHGGADQAVYAYAREDLDAWAGELGEHLRPGQFGENLTTVGVDVTGAVIGEQWRAGSVLLEVSGPRLPCVVFQTWMRQPRWVRRFTQYGRPGAYLRVLAEGDVGAGDAIEIVHRPAHGVTIEDTFRAANGDRPAARRALAADELSPKLRASLEQSLAATESAS